MKSKQILFFGLLLTVGCQKQSSYEGNSLLGHWELVNSPFDMYEPVNATHEGISIYSDSLEFIADYMNKPIFDYRKYSIQDDSIYIDIRNVNKAFSYKLDKDSLFLSDAVRVFHYLRLFDGKKNALDRIEFNSMSPSPFDIKRGFNFSLSLSQNGEIYYKSTSGDIVLEGHLSEKYTSYIFDKLNRIDLPLQFDRGEIIPAGDHLFTLELFESSTRVDSVTYSRGIQGAYLKWLSSILQSTPLWIDQAVVRNIDD